MILVDPPHQGLKRWKYGASSHMTSDLSLDELHAFAKKIGCNRAWFQGNHYDLTTARYEAAVKAGAAIVGTRELIKRMVHA